MIITPIYEKNTTDLTELSGSAEKNDLALNDNILQSAELADKQYKSPPIEKNKSEGVGVGVLPNQKKYTCNQILAEFILSICEYVTVDFYKELTVVIILFRKALNEKGRAFKEKRGEAQNENIELCSEFDISVASEISNYFIAELFPSYFKKINGYFVFIKTKIGIQVITF